MFLGKKRRWDDGTLVKATSLKGGDAHEKFCKSVLNKTPAQLMIYQKRAIFTGGARSQRSFENEEELVKYIEKTEGAIGYIHPSTNHENVTEIMRIR